LDDKSRRALALLGRWDGAMDATRPQPLIFTAWMRALVRVIAEDELGPLFPQMWDLKPDFVRLVLTRETAWCDNATTPKVETCGDALAMALSQAMAEETTVRGDAIETWRWGEAHPAHFRHTPFSFIPVLRELADIRTPIGGGDDTVLRAAMPVASATPYEAVHGAGVRAVYDLADLSASRFSLSTGQSGNPMSAHYDDLLAFWRSGQTFTVTGTRASLRETAEGDLTLVPAIQ
jgi:penicillin amidase